jgi:hypothetical protein
MRISYEITCYAGTGSDPTKSNPVPSPMSIGENSHVPFDFGVISRRMHNLGQ